MTNDRITALIVGAGAVQNAWLPVLRALQPYYDFPLTDDGGNCILARLVYLLRWYASDSSELGKTELAKHKSFLVEIRKAICTEIKKSEKNNELRIRKEFDKVFDKMVVQHSATFLLITTNWDDVVGQALSRRLNRSMVGIIRPLHIHGSTRDDDLLYLPTELTKEPYRSGEETRKIGGIHGSIWRRLEDVSRVVV